MIYLSQVKENLERLKDYNFECEAGKLENCIHYTQAISLVSATNWNTIDTAPKDKPILVCGGTWGIDCDNEFEVKSCWIVEWRKNGWCGGPAHGEHHDSEYWLKPSYWMDLPEIIK